MLSEYQVNIIEQRLLTENARVFVMDVEGTKMVIKRQQDARSAFRYTLLRLSSRLVREPLLMPAYVPGGATAQDIEVSRIKELAQAGVSVPRLLHVCPDWIALSYLGESNLIDMVTKSEHPLKYWEQGLAAISDVHQKGQSLSQVFIRNMMYQDGKVVFIDFEDEPAKAMGMSNAQARDWVFFLFSSVWMLPNSRAELAKIVMKYMQQDRPAVQEAVLHTAKSLAWLRRLPKKRKPWGRDTIAVQGYAELLYEVSKYRKPKNQKLLSRR